MVAAHVKRERLGLVFPRSSTLCHCEDDAHERDTYISRAALGVERGQLGFNCMTIHLS